MKTRRFEDHFDFEEAARRTCLSVSKLRQLVRSGAIDPVVELPGPKVGCSKILIPSSSLAKFLSVYRVVRNPEGI